jgi:hypothetical protein
MRFHRVTLIVALYLGLDFANPMTPGAVQLVGGSLETVAGCQPRSGEAPVLTATMAPCPVVADVPQHEPVIRTHRWAVSASPPVPVLFRASFEPRSTVPSSPDDD